MNPPPAPAPVPAPEKPKGPFVIGVLNIVLGILGVLCNCYSGFNAAMMPFADSMMKQAQAKIDAQRKASVDDFEQQLADAEDEEARVKVQKEYDRWKDKNPPFDFSGMYAWSKDPRFLVPTIGDAVVSLLLNVLMIAAGIGLVKYRPWSRSMAMWVACLKIGAVAVSAVLMITLVVPAFSDGMEHMLKSMEEMQRQMPNAPPPMPMIDSIGQMYRVMGTAFVIASSIFAAAYPIVVLCVIGSKRNRRAFESP